MNSILFLIILISFIASLFRSTLGFGESLIGVPLFLFILPPEIAVPLSILISIVIALVVVVQDHSKIHFKSAKWLIAYAVLGIPIGILVLLYADETLVKISLGLLIVFYSLFSLFAKRSLHLQEDHKVWLFACGFLSGIFGGAYGLNGPPLVIYGSLRKWTAKHFRATLQAYFLPVGVITTLGYYYKGLITAELYEYFLYALIGVVPAIFLGRYLNHQLKDDSFLRYAYWSLVIIGGVLVVNGLK